MFLTTSAYAYIAEYTEDRARSLGMPKVTKLFKAHRGCGDIELLRTMARFYR